MRNQMKTHPTICRLAIWASLAVAFMMPVQANDRRDVELEDGISIPVEIFRAEQPLATLLWLPSERGMNEGMRHVAQALAYHEGVNVWLADPFSAWLLPATQATMNEIEPHFLLPLLDEVHKEEPRVLLLSHDRGSILALRLARLWQEAHPGDERLAGVVLVTPNLYTRTPAVGDEGQFAAIASETNLPVFLMQPTLSPTALRVRDIADTLGTGGSRVFVRMLHDVRDRFFFRPDANDEERVLTGELPGLLRQAIRLLLTEQVPATAAISAAISREVEPETAEDRRRTLGPYSGEDAENPPPLSLVDTEGVMRSLADLQGSVVLLNFWASWCPPCLHEMPSMERVMHRYRDQGFEIAAVNLGEPEERIRDFVEELEITFPVWLDPENATARQWRVFTFPTSYLIDRRGHIRYAIAGGIEWDEAEAIEKIEELLAEPAP